MLVCSGEKKFYSEKKFASKPNFTFKIVFYIMRRNKFLFLPVSVGDGVTCPLGVGQMRPFGVIFTDN